jgi:hypothetical protein
MGIGGGVPLRSESINKLWGSMMFPIRKITMPQKKFPARLANGGQPTISGLSLIQIPRLNFARRLKRMRKEQDICSFHDLITEDKTGTIQKDRKNRYYDRANFLPFLFSNGDFFFSTIGLFPHSGRRRVENGRVVVE